MADHEIPSILEKIANSTRKRVEREQEILPLAKLLESPAMSRVPHDFTSVFTWDKVFARDEVFTPDEFPGSPIRVIAEVKLASPSEGPLAPHADPVLTALDYISAGAAAISVLTEPEFFKGSIHFMSQIRTSAQPQTRILMKDFIVDEYQLAQARAFGADAVLLIVAMQNQDRLKTLFREALKLGLTPLVEVHNEGEMDQALDLGAKLIGVNHRNLKTLKIDMGISERIWKQLCQQKTELEFSRLTLIAESGIDSKEAMLRLSALGYQGFLIGSHFMKSGAPGQALAKLLGKVASP